MYPQIPPPKPIPDGGHAIPAQIYESNPVVGRILWMRIDGLSAQDLQALDQVITPQTYPTLVKLFPELAALMQRASSMQGQQQVGAGQSSPAAYYPPNGSALGAIGAAGPGVIAQSGIPGANG